MNPADLADLLDMLARAVRALPAATGTVVAATTAAQQHTLAQWLAVYERLIGERGYKAQTIKNHRANLAHVRRLWGEKALRGLRPHEVSSALREFLPEHSSTDRRVLAELRDAYTEAVANDWAENNPAARVKMPAHHVLRARLTFEDEWKVVELSDAG